MCGRCTRSTSVSFCVQGAALGAPPERSAEVRILILRCKCKHLDRLIAILRGRCSTWSTSREVRGSPATIEYYQRRLLLRRLLLRGRCSTLMEYYGHRRLLVAGYTALGAPQSHFAWQVQHSEHLSVILRGRCSTGSTSSTEVRRRLSTMDAEVRKSGDD